ncbi:hypothetical protein J4430_02960 [Candidatus Woesearchaeota archaeon]|nr:hypothetical protein [Candidatus Woesearchaeota archaeon]
MSATDILFGLSIFSFLFAIFLIFFGFRVLRYETEEFRQRFAIVLVGFIFYGITLIFDLILFSSVFGELPSFLVSLQPILVKVQLLALLPLSALFILVAVLSIPHNRPKEDN